VLGDIPSPKEQSGTGTAAQGVVGSRSLDVFHNCGEVALRDVVSGHGGMGWVGDLRALFQPEGFYGSMNPSKLRNGCSLLRLELTIATARTAAAR